MAGKKKDLVPSERPKVNMAHAASLMAEMMARIDKGEDVTDMVVQAFNETRLDLAESIDRRFAFKKYMDGTLFALKMARQDLQLKEKLLEKAYEGFAEKTMEVMEAHPDLPYKGTYGNEIRLQANGGLAALKIEQIPQRRVTVDWVVDHEQMDFFGIPCAWVKTTEVMHIDTDKVRAALEEGQEISWARLERGKHLRFI